MGHTEGYRILIQSFDDTVLSAYSHHHCFALALVLAYSCRPVIDGRPQRMVGQTFRVLPQSAAYDGVPGARINCRFDSYNTKTREMAFSASIAPACLEAFDEMIRVDPEQSLGVFSEEGFPGAVRRLGTRLYEWSQGNPHIARALFLFALQLPEHPFWDARSSPGRNYRP